MGAYTEVTLDGETLNVLTATPIRRQKTIKQVLGKKLVQVEIIGIGAQQWELRLTGVITGSDVSDLSTKRATLEAFDNLETHDFIDGIHDGTYYVLPESLTFEDTGDRGNMSYIYSITLIEE